MGRVTGRSRRVGRWWRADGSPYSRSRGSAPRPFCPISSSGDPPRRLGVFRLSPPWPPHPLRRTTAATALGGRMGHRSPDDLRRERRALLRLGLTGAALAAFPRSVQAAARRLAPPD